MNDTAASGPYSLVVVEFIEARRAQYSLEDAARMADMHPEMLRFYCRRGFFGEALAQPGSELIFDDDALYELRRFGHYRRQNAVNRKALRVIADLTREVERLRDEVRFLRGA